MYRYNNAQKTVDREKFELDFSSKGAGMIVATRSESVFACLGL